MNGSLVDLHSHILPGIDDGSPDVGTSAAMLRREAEQGVDVVCATSHYYAKHSSIPAFCERRAEAMCFRRRRWRIFPAWKSRT